MLMFFFSQARLQDCYDELKVFEADIAERTQDLIEIDLIDVLRGYVDGIKTVVRNTEGLEISEDAYYDMYLDLAEMDISIDYQRGMSDGMKFALSTLGETSLDRWARV